MHKSVELITATPIHQSIGDQAIQFATIDQLAACGIPCRLSDQTNDQPSHDSVRYIVGGGHVLANPTHGLTQFHMQGQHFLNGAGIVDDSPDLLEHLRDYCYVSVRDRYSHEILERMGIESALVPDPAFALKPFPVELEKLSADVMHWQSTSQNKLILNTSDALMYLFQDKYSAEKPEYFMLPMQAWRQDALRSRKKPKVLPPRYSAREYLSMIRYSRGVIADSLHLLVFGLIMNLPTLFIADREQYNTPQSLKIIRYCQSHGLEDVIFQHPEGKTTRKDIEDFLLNPERNSRIKVAVEAQKTQCHEALQVLASQVRNWLES